MTPRLAALAEAWLAGDLDEAGAAELRRAAEADPAVATWLREQAVIDQGLRTATGTSADLRAAVRARLAARGKSQVMRAAVVARLRRRRVWWRWQALAAAALLLLGVSAGWWLQTASSSGATVVTLAGDVRVAGRPVAIGAQVPAQAQMTVAGTDGVLGIRFTDGSEATLSAGSARLRDDAGGVGLLLDAGRVACVVRPRSGRPPFVIGSRFGEVVVVGTRFTVSVDGHQAALQVDEGVVRLDTAGTSTPVAAGGSLRFGADGIQQGAVPDVVLPAPDEWLPPAGAPPSSAPLPAWDGIAVAGAPAIAAWNGSAQAGDGVVLTGARFGRAPVAWLWTAIPGGGRYDRITPHDVSADAVAVRLPKDLPRGVHLLWLANGAGASAPVRLGAPQVRWLAPGTTAPAPGQPLRVIGRDLAGVQVWLQRGSRWRALSVVGGTANDLTVTVPADVAIGPARVLVQRPEAGALGWSEPLDLTITQAWHRPVRAQSVTPGGGDDTARIQAAIDGLADAGGTVHLAEGDFRLEGTVQLRAGVRLSGGGRSRTRLLLAPGRELRQAITIAGDHVTLTDLTLRGVRSTGRYAYGVIGMPDAQQAEDVLLAQVRIDAEPGVVLEHLRLDGRSIVMRECDVAVQVRLGGDGVWLSGNRLRGGPLDDTTAAVVFGGRRLVLEDNHIASDWPRRADGTAMSLAEARADRPGRPWCPQAFTVDQHYGPVEHLYLRGNRIADIGADREPRSLVQFQTSGSPWSAVVASAVGTSVRLRPGSPPAPAGFTYGAVDGLAYLVVLSGPGRGQVSQVVRRAAGEIAVRTPWRVPPADGSVVGLTYLVRDVLMSANDLAGPPAGAVGEPFVGVDLAGGVWDVLLSGNTMRTATGRRLRGSAIQPTAWIEVRDSVTTDSALVLEQNPGATLEAPAVFGVSGAATADDGRFGPNVP